MNEGVWFAFVALLLIEVVYTREDVEENVNGEVEEVHCLCVFRRVLLITLGINTILSMYQTSWSDLLCTVER